MKDGSLSSGTWQLGTLSRSSTPQVKAIVSGQTGRDPLPVSSSAYAALLHTRLAVSSQRRIGIV